MLKADKTKIIKSQTGWINNKLYGVLKMLSRRSMFFSEVYSKVNFTISPTSTIEALHENVQENDLCVYWYFGARGFKQGAIDFYKPFLTQNILHNAKSFLVDLTAWASFTSSTPITRYHESAVSLESDVIKTLKCSDFFLALQNINPTHESVFNLIKEITDRIWLLEPSFEFPETGIALKDIFNNECPALENIKGMDCGKCYSVIQYIEFLFLVEQVLNKTDLNSYNIKFILPNDEGKYYLDSMAYDLETFLTARGHNFDRLNVEVQSFHYGQDLLHRPYNCPSKTIPGKKKLAIEKIVNSAILDNTQPLQNTMR